MAARVRKRGVGAAALAEFGIHLNHGAHVHHQHKGRTPLRRGQGAGVVFALAAGTQQAVVKAFGVGANFELFGLQHKVTALVAVNAPGTAGAVTVAEGHGALEHVVLLGRGVRFVNVQQRAQFQDKALRGG